MQITFNNSFFGTNYKSPKYLLQNNVNFRGGRQELISVATESFSMETSKKLFSKILKYFKLIGESGRIEKVKVLKEQGRYFGEKAQYLGSVDSETDIFMSISKTRDAANLSINQNYSDLPNERNILLNANFDKNGQMIYGIFPPEGLRFERTGSNVRRILRDKKIYLPLGGNDKKWECCGKELLAGNCKVFATDDSISGVYEIFLELARLKTSIYKSM